MTMSAFDQLLNQVHNLSPEQREQLLGKLQGGMSTSEGSESTGRSLFDVFYDHGMIGAITDAPADWSTNPKYMEGCGQDAE